MRRNPKTKTIQRPVRVNLRGCRTPGAMLLELAKAAPPETSLKLLAQAAKLVKAEVEAGMWSDPPPQPRPFRRQPCLRARRVPARGPTTGACGAG